MNIAKLLLNLDNKYNDHHQTVIKGLTLKQGMKICKKLEKYTDNKESFVLELWTDGNFSVYQKDCFPMGNPSGRDKLILSTDS